MKTESPEQDRGDELMKPPFIENGLFRKGEALGELLVRPFHAFASRQASSGVLILLASGLAVVWVNSPFNHSYELLWESVLKLGIGDWSFEKTLHFWVTDGLMTVFFFVVGLVIKREILVGELASFRKAALPIVAALGGMLVPALIYSVFNWGSPLQRGWAIPMATDIALTLGALTLLRSRVSHSLVVFVAALAIVDDLGAVVVIAVFYTADISIYYLQLSGLIVVSLAAANVLGFRSPIPYMILGILLWVTIYLSGVHTTIAGVLLAMTTPARSAYDTDTFLVRSRSVLNEFECAGSCGYSVYTNENHQAAIQTLEGACHGVLPPLLRIESALHPWVVFLIVPLFGIANAGVHIEWAALGKTFTSPLSLGIIIGLFVGKPVGVFAAVWLAVKTGFGAFPTGTTWRQIYGGATLCGIGFTMSLLIAHLAFHGAPVFDESKMSIFLGSLCSAVVGMAILYWAPERTVGETRSYDRG
ncbi:MAG: Na+/H+ antiporter NhaA [Desulfomonilaceae bacterium]|nr:Na+/H+ antiporter NhaA [Desulfomonilaceae bacterium]